MKKYLLLLNFFSLVIVPILGAQPYQSLFGTDSTKWVFRWINLNTVGDDYYHYQKDTLINDTTYKKIIYNTFPDSQISTLIREDTISGKVWIRPIDPGGSGLDLLEYLAFDFSLNVGDTFDVRNLVSDYAPIYRKVDSIKYIDGLKYIYFDYFIHYAGDPGPWEIPTMPTEPLALIEGIGSNGGPLWKNYYGGMLNQYLMCSYKDGVQTSYKNLRYSGLCPQQGSGIKEEINATSTIKIYPNPAGNYIIMDGDHNRTLQSAGIYDLSGRKVRDIRTSGKIDISLISSGLYLVKMTTIDQVTHTEKLIIHH